MVKRNLITKTKKQPVVRKSVTSEEKHVGLETVDWIGVKDIHRATMDTLSHYRYFNDTKDGVKWVASWIKKYMTKEDLINYQQAETWRTSMTAASLAKMHMNGAPWDAERITWIKTKIQEAIDAGKQNKIAKMKEATTNVVKRSIADIVKENTSDFIGAIEEVLDTWFNGTWIDIENYSVYNELKKINAPSNTAKAIVDYYTPLKEEIEELINQKTPDLVEGYKHLTAARKKEYLKLINVIIDDAERYINSKKAVRKTRVAKPKSASQQVSKLKYLKESAEYKLVSIDPINIIGSSELWLFNVKYKTAIKCVTQAASGFTLKGTTLQGMDVSNTGKKKLRKPEDFLKEFGASTKAKANKLYNDLTTKPSEFNGRINEDTIILKAYK